MSKKILVFAVLFLVALSMTITQEANALTQGNGYFNWSTASLGLSKVCGNHVCAHGENSKWIHAVMVSQREGPGKATGGYQGHVIMYQLVVNSLAKNNNASSIIDSSHMNTTMPTNNTNTNSTG